MENIEGEVNPGKSETETKRWSLLSVLIVLIIVIVGLIVGIVIVRMNTSSPETGFDPTSEINIDDIVVNENDLSEGETVEEVKERLYQQKKWQVAVENIEKQVDELLDENPVDAVAINKLYNEGIEKAKEEGRYVYVYALVRSRSDKYLEKNLKREALDALMSVDLEMFDNVEDYRFCSQIIQLANELGDKEVANKYIEIRKKYEADFVANGEETAHFVEAIGINNGIITSEDKNE